MIDINNIGLIAMAGGLFAFWNPIKNGFLRLVSFFWRTHEINGYSVAVGFLNEIFEDTRIVHFGNFKYQTTYSKYILKYGVNYHTIFRTQKEILLFKGLFPILIRSDKNGSCITVSFLNHTVDIEKYIEKSYLKSIQNQKEWVSSSKRFGIYKRSGRDNSGAIGTSLEPKPANKTERIDEDSFFDVVDVYGDKAYLLGGISIDEFKQNREEKDNSYYYWQKEGLLLRKDIEFFTKNASWFNDRNIKYFRSALLYGQSGTGKSKAVLECAKYSDMPLYHLDISDMSNTEFTDYMLDVQYNSIVLIEDIDSTFEGRINLHAKKSMSKNLLTFECLINTINGIRELNGIYLIITTNHPEKLDPALIRAGRTDLKIEFKPLDLDGRNFIAKNILKDFPETINQIVGESKDQTVVDFQDKCCRLAIEKFYERDLLLVNK